METHNVLASLGCMFFAGITLCSFDSCNAQMEMMHSEEGNAMNKDAAFALLLSVGVQVPDMVKIC